MHMNITNTSTETFICELDYTCGGVPGSTDASIEDVGRACNGYLLSSSSYFEIDLLCTDRMTEWMAVIESFVKCPRDPISKVVKWD